MVSASICFCCASANELIRVLDEIRRACCLDALKKRIQQRLRCKTVLRNHFRTGQVRGFISFVFSKEGVHFSYTPMFSKHQRAAAAAAALIFAATASLSAATGANAETVGTGKADAAFDKTLGQLIREPGGPLGAIAAVQRGHDVKVFHKGVADQKTAAPIRVPDRWRIGSVSKAFNGAVALRLVAQGKLSLSDTIGQRLPTLPFAWHNVTLGQLLNHTSGLPNFTNAPGWQRAVQEGEYLSPMDLIGLVSAQPLAFPPGSNYAYSNTDNTVVALFAEMATGLSYELLLYQLVFDPLHLRRTVMPLGFSMQGLFVHGYDNNATGERDDISEALNMSAVWAAGALISSLFDLTGSFEPTPEASCLAARRGPPRPTSCAAGSPSRKVPARTRRGWASSSTTLGAGPSTGTRATSPATRPSP
jgi:D-alanyl-D-alanine carboxypeptidase